MEKSNLEEKYEKLEHSEHVLKRPGMYIGSDEEDTYNTWVYDEVTKHFVKKEVRIVPGLYKIIDEILVNAIDHTVRMKMVNSESNSTALPVKNIKIDICKETGIVTVWNDGDGIEVDMHPKHRIWIPELIFGNMLTSTNYNDSEEKIIGGQNGIGAKACNIFSKSFKIETVDHIRKKLYIQEFRDNMTAKNEPTVKYCAKKPYTAITFLPDYDRFKVIDTPSNGNKMSDDMYGLLVRRVYDVCALTDNDVNVWLNGAKLDIKNFEKYTDMYLGPKNETFRAYEKINDRWEVVASVTDVPGFEQISFVNGIWTVYGGKHVEYISNQITTQMIDLLAKKKKETNVKPQHVRNYLMLFVKATITNPTFSSQSKESLTTTVAKFGSKGDLSEKFMDKLYKSELINKVMSLCATNVNKALKKTDGKKTTRVLVSQLDDANLAGTKNSHECTLILTEGLSARTMAISGLSVVGRDKYGVFPLRGKLLNVKEAPPTRIQDNEEISNLKKILGLEHGKEYTDVSDLRYGRIMTMCDSDVDGFHIKGLIFNLFESLWPSLYKSEGFLTSMLTPIIKVTHTRTKATMSFYSLTDYENFAKEHEADIRSWKVKYYKGLGTSTEEEAKQYFEEMKLITYTHTEDSDEALDLAFNKKRADDRKKWLMEYDRERILDYTQVEVPFNEFINKELIHFSNSDVQRSLNHLCDGLKESTRKIMFACLKRRLFKDDIKVAQLAAYVAEVSEYKHGETSLQEAIVGMAQMFVGANNINLLMPNGQFGTRIRGGQDAAQPRYIFTRLTELARLIFKDEDTPVLKHIVDEGTIVEPEYYIPIIPMILVNGGIGIGTGFSTNVPCFNPDDVITACETIAEALMVGVGAVESIEDVDFIAKEIECVELESIKPWYMGFKGSIIQHKATGYTSKGIYKWLDDTTVEVTELPVGTWTDDYKDMLIDMCAKNDHKYLKDFEDGCSAKNIRFKLKMQPGARAVLDAGEGAKFETEFKLASTKNLSLNNIHLHGDHGAVRKFKDTDEVIKAWAKVRIIKYVERKRYMLKAMEDEYTILSAKVRFISEIISGEVVVQNREIEDVDEQLSIGKYPTKSDGGEDAGGYQYLTRMPIYQLTLTKKKALEKEADDLKSKMDALRDKPIQIIWKEELAALRKAWHDYKAEIECEYGRDKDHKPQATAQKRKATPKKKTT